MAITLSCTDIGLFVVFCCCFFLLGKLRSLFPIKISCVRIAQTAVEYLTCAVLKLTGPQYFISADGLGSESTTATTNVGGGGGENLLRVGVGGWGGGGYCQTV